MILGIGTDIIEIERVKKALMRDGFKQMVFSEKEIEYCDKDRKCERYAARYAAKEAFFKALGTGWSGDTSLQSVEVLNDERGKPIIVLSGNASSLFRDMGGIAVQVSISHVKETAIAFVIIEGK